MIGNTRLEINAARRRAQARVETRPPNIGRNDDGKINCWRPIPKVTLKDIDGATVEFTAKHFLKKHCDILNTETKQFAPAANGIERRMIDDAMKKNRWNKQKAAEALGLSRQGLAKMLKRLGIMAEK